VSARSLSNTAGAFIRSPWIMTGAWGTAPTGAHRLISANILQNNPLNLSLLDQAVASRAGLPPEERVRPGESALARCAMTCSRRLGGIDACIPRAHCTIVSRQAHSVRHIVHFVDGSTRERRARALSLTKEPRSCVPSSLSYMLLERRAWI
jgi:hypothetical protein